MKHFLGGREFFLKNKSKFSLLIIAFLTALLGSILFKFDFFVNWREKISDSLFVSQKVDSPIVILSIDNRSLKALGRWPWDRKIHAEIIDNLKKNKAAVVGYDVNFPEVSDEISDKALSESLKKADNVFLPIEVEYIVQQGEAKSLNELKPIAILADSAKNLGLTNIHPDQDGVIRKVPIFIEEDEGFRFKALSFQLVDEYLKKNPEINLKEISFKQLMRINYEGPPGSFKTISAFDLLQGKVPRQELENKIVLVGATASDLHDEYMTPVSNGKPMSGVEIIANQINTILNSNYLYLIADLYQIMIFFGLSLVIGVLFIRFKVIIAIFLSLILFSAYFLTALIVFDYGWILDLFYPLVITSMIVFLLTLNRFFNEESEKKYIRKVFSQYVSKDVINELLVDPKKVRLGGREEELTMLFSDVRDFTKISEKLSPKQLTDLLNKYFNQMTETIIQYRGVLDKYIGDAIMAFWGAPLFEKKHAYYACKAALLMIKKLDSKKSEWERDYQVKLNIGIGINSGKVVVGNMGSNK
ncbi:MAG: CHASE2 domain-containing protein, partial [Candidatus Moranbacteria bacterium]|nr:CHASE2 domain-containing protein [Candidatus Moranbacteria bacterium]